MSRPASYMTGFAPRDFRPAHPELWRGCVGAWAPCLGPTGVTLRDWSGFQRHGTLTNMDAGTDWAIGGGQYCIDFDGTDDYVQLGDITLADGFSHMAVSLWVYMSGAGKDWVGQWSASGSNRSWRIQAENTSNPAEISVGVQKNALNSNFHKTTGLLSWHTWHHVAWNWLGNTSHEVYLNGTSRSVSSFFTQGTVDTLSGSSTADYRIGNFAGENDPWTGMLDDIRVYNRNLSLKEILQLGLRRGIAYEPAKRRVKAPQTFNPAWARGSNILIHPGSL